MQIVMLPVLVVVLFFPCIVFSHRSFQKLPLPPATSGPEAFAFDPSGKGPYTGVSGGKILKFEGPSLGFVEFAYTSSFWNTSLCNEAASTIFGLICGRPVGIAFDLNTGKLYIADAFLGLYVASPLGGQAQRLADSAEGIPFRFLDGLDVDPTTGDVFFTSFSSAYSPSQVLLAVAAKDATGKLFRYKPATKTVTVLMTGLSGSAGCAVSSDGSFVLVGEFIKDRIMRYWIKGPKAGTSEIFTPFIRGPDNIRRAAHDEFWVASNVMKFVVPTEPSAVRVNVSGGVVCRIALQGQYGVTLVSEVNEFDGVLFLGTLTTGFVGVLG